MDNPASPDPRPDMKLPTLVGVSPQLQLTVDTQRTILDNLDEGVYLVDGCRHILYWNKAAERITGFSAAEVIGHSCADNILTHVDEHGRCLCTEGCPLAAVQESGQTMELEVYLHHKQGHRVPTVIHAVPLFDTDGSVMASVEIFSNASDQRLLQDRVAELEAMAYLDPLTQLPNRRYAIDTLSKRLAECARIGWRVGVAMIDIDNFKNFNDTYGHAVGDEVLQLVGRTLTASTRSSDTIGRWGGEEFLAIFTNVDAAMLEPSLERLRVLVAASGIRRQDANIGVTISLGATLSQQGDTVESIVQRADTLLYKSKETGRDRVTFEHRQAA